MGPTRSLRRPRPERAVLLQANVAGRVPARLEALVQPLRGQGALPDGVYARALLLAQAAAAGARAGTPLAPGRPDPVLRGGSSGADCGRLPWVRRLDKRRVGNSPADLQFDVEWCKALPRIILHL